MVLYHDLCRSKNSRIQTVAFINSLRVLKRPDKDWGLTDCISFAVMTQEGITQALTSDRHFEQAGFTKLLSIKKYWNLDKVCVVAIHNCYDNTLTFLCR